MATKVIHIKYAPEGWRENPDYVYIGRPSKWGNPFEVRSYGRDGAVAQHAIWFQRQPELMESLHELKDKTLVCFCHPSPCHGHILARLADETPREV